MKRAMSTSDCKACAGTWPPADHRIADCGLAVAYLFEDQFFSGWTVLVLKRHARELFDLTKGERSQVIEEVAEVARALSEVFQPVKINYGSLGNQLPHMHWHVIPRLAGDPAPMEAPWGVKHEPVRLAEGELRETIARIQAKLKR
ncbi:MAG: HIT family protein [Nitrospira sp.]|nr:HIT family protein [Nitrospira sp.]